MLANVACHIAITLRLLLSQNKPSEMSRAGCQTLHRRKKSSRNDRPTPKTKQTPAGQYDQKKGCLH